MFKAEWTKADALDLQPNCNQLATDCVSRRAAIDTVWESTNQYDAERRIKALPSAEPERKTGRWIDHDVAEGWCICSVCGEVSIEYSYYCPYCGAKMEGESE